MKKRLVLLRKEDFSGQNATGYNPGPVEPPSTDQAPFVKLKIDFIEIKI